ncbi:hypothetical protein H8356DRAFT_963126 [Neocallimastix lanati (nom. inval.)]|nr:hypothetical protein H8356DRAFT_963126 [Neocallimastix sp. JGI-2020a]
MISHILSKNDDLKKGTNEAMNDRSNTLNREKEDFINNYQKASKIRKLNNNNNNNNNFKRNDRVGIETSSPSPQTILPKYAIEIFFKQFLDQFFQEFHYMERVILNDQLDVDAFLFRNMTLKESYEKYCPQYPYHNSSSLNSLPPDVICTNYDQYRQYSNTMKEVTEVDNDDRGIQYQYFQQLYHHDFYFPLYDSLQKIQSLMILISKSSCTLYIYTLTLLLKECRKHLQSYFKYIESVHTIKGGEEDDNNNNSENDTTIDEFEEENLKNDENSSYHEEKLKEEYFFSRELDRFMETYLVISTHSHSSDYSSSSLSPSSSTMTTPPSPFYFPSPSLPYGSLIKLKMSQLLNQLKILSKDWNEIKFLRYEMIQDFNNLPSNV